jgi:hypothetical protein
MVEGEDMSAEEDIRWALHSELGLISAVVR